MYSASIKMFFFLCKTLKSINKRIRKKVKLNKKKQRYNYLLLKIKTLKRDPSMD